MSQLAPSMPAVRADWTFPVWTVVMFSISLVGEGGYMLYQFGKLDQRLTQVEEKVREVGTAPETVARLDERTKAMQADLSDIKTRLGSAR